METIKTILKQDTGDICLMKANDLDQENATT